MKKFFKRVGFVLTFWRFIPFFIDYLIAKDIVLWKKLLPIGLAVAYIFIPIDLIPDFLFIFGYTDDVLFTTFILQSMVKYAPERLKEKYRKLTN
ncbi:uncharacterized membrane protein YkvA (DUF1232 family) [Cytobacillus horneckiae]|uniref:DUF1232 domain-containing protein n=1 Tax=Cytobacillus horneckiae TaxID=549687 RepID=A0A2N0ZBL6_9BACI|nr:DUF1232 domain-containing protein [Cytobacillus horneckiae]NRG47013.1 DUF1232 domain-containing protein [Bacillus sp. CRN 9]MBN6885309.1 DUF1232 domain-containing protein [Cytobacillus horneckiae]MCM3178962.1 DUF1232 domain-containing protein [Cytobacillus horneckiae]MEC1154178.1 DUF1232 domain-containing protein [Cytobacillus horneckiae]MED2936277.1 DUF1232 domain-containing protein [Cytobacillus horneckiae]